MLQSAASPAPALDGGLTILEAVAASPVGLGFAQIEALLPQSKATVVRLLKVLQGRGYLRKASDGRYRPGPALAALAPADAVRDLLRRAGAGELQALLAQTGNTVLLLYWDGAVFECVAKAAAEHGLAMQPVGNTCDRYELTPWGRIGWLQLSPAERERVAATRSLPRGFVRQVSRDETELAAQGFVVEDTGRPATLRRLAAPIADDGHLHGCLALGGNALTITDAQLARIGRTLVSTAQRIARALESQEETA
jgi:DNA-binding IclR family transcriptional regulator